ncbi:hypothetical protein CI109_104388 [Kwoniella shandongensis]|uniref:Uncharacterized protein n=1 Tax=Kwoniella shandongensis TaxID=1734106 RepID=A0A5M6BYD6_9TREE|nr:uncharacterized protein CI109_004214 [Kwoniella shandongensis]KAA5527401.1 hypothetical protein CI109_004214 [Kwoniella shandongensis]
MQLTSKSILLFFLFATTVFATTNTHSHAQAHAQSGFQYTMANKNVIVQFKKTSSADDRQKAISDLTSKGATVVNDDNVNSKIMPFITVSLPEDNFGSFESEFSGGSHSVVEHIEADQEVRIQ